MCKFTAISFRDAEFQGAYFRSCRWLSYEISQIQIMEPLIFFPIRSHHYISLQATPKNMGVTRHSCKLHAGQGNCIHLPMLGSLTALHSHET